MLSTYYRLGAQQAQEDACKDLIKVAKIWQTGDAWIGGVADKAMKGLHSGIEGVQDFAGRVGGALSGHDPRNVDAEGLIEAKNIGLETVKKKLADAEAQAKYYRDQMPSSGPGPSSSMHGEEAQFHDFAKNIPQGGGEASGSMIPGGLEALKAYAGENPGAVGGAAAGLAGVGGLGLGISKVLKGRRAAAMAEQAAAQGKAQTMKRRLMGAGALGAGGLGLAAMSGGNKDDNSQMG